MNKMNLLKNIAAIILLVAGVAACSKSNTVVENEPLTEATFTQTIHVTLGGPDTRAVDADGHKSWSNGEQVIIFYSNSANNLTTKTGILSNVSGKSADITVTFSEVPKANGDMTLVYPSSAAAAITADRIVPTLLNNQDGTLATLSSTLDVATATVQATASSEMPENITLRNAFSIFKFTLMNGSTDLTASTTNLNINDGTNNYNISRTAEAGPIYVAMRPIVSANFTFSAIAGGDNYSLSKSGVTIAASKIYNSTLNMDAAGNVGKILCTDGSIYATVSEAETASKTVSGMIAYEGSETGVAGKTNGLVISVTQYNGNYSDVETWVSSLATERPAGASAWAIPTVTQWMRIMQACGGSVVTTMPTDANLDFSWGLLSTKITNCEGGNMAAISTSRYWTSTDGSSSGTKVVYYPRSQYFQYRYDEASYGYCRAIFAW